MNYQQKTLALAFLTVAAGVLPANGQSEPSPISQGQISELIADLGRDDFARREQATARLLQIGQPALAQLRAVPGSASFEVRHRAELLRQRIEKEKFAELSKSFLLDLDASNSYGLPAWSAYRDLVGSSRTSKLLFLEMIRDQPEIAQLIEQQTQPNASSPASQQQLSAVASQEALRIREGMYSLLEPKIGDVVGLLLASATLESQTPIEISEVIVNNERRSFGSNIHKQGYSNCLRKLMASWIPKTHAALAPTAMDIALRYDLPVGAEIARQHLTPNFDSDTRKWAFYSLARFGDETDIPRLLPLLEDATVVDEFDRNYAANGIHESNSAPPGAVEDPVVRSNMVVCINDLALVTIVLLAGDDPEQVFAGFEPNPQLGFFIHSLATPAESPELRKQRIEKWKNSQAVPLAVES